MPRWGIEARRRLRRGDLVKGHWPDPDAPRSDVVNPESLIRFAANRPVIFWAVTAFFYLTVLYLIAVIAFTITHT